jgi:hypothetical protein
MVSTVFVGQFAPTICSVRANVSCLVTNPHIQDYKEHLDDGVDDLSIVHNCPQQRAGRDYQSVRRYVRGFWFSSTTMALRFLARSLL